MTVIAAVRTAGRVVLAADSICMTGWIAHEDPPTQDLPHFERRWPRPRWAVLTLVPAMQAALQDAEVVLDDDQVSAESHCEPRDDYAAVGSGREVALGALHATVGGDPEDRVRAAVYAACHHHRTCGGKVHVEWT